MIAKKSYYRSTIEHKYRTLAEIYVDRELIGIMQSRIRKEINDAAGFQFNDADNPDEIEDSHNYIKDLIKSYEELTEALEEIDAQEAISKIPPDEDNG